MYLLVCYLNYKMHGATIKIVLFGSLNSDYYFSYAALIDNRNHSRHRDGVFTVRYELNFYIVDSNGFQNSLL